MAKDNQENDPKNYLRGDKSAARPMSYPTFPKRVTEPSNPLGLSSLAAIGEPAPSSIEPVKMEDSKRLVVGREITLNGEISTCDILVVQGKVEASLKQCKTLEISADGEFRGTVTVDNAEINGLFEGQLTVNRRLTVKEKGHLSGKIRYLELEVEQGGIISGTLEPIADNGNKSMNLIGKEVTKDTK